MVTADMKSVQTQTTRNDLTACNLTVQKQLQTKGYCFRPFIRGAATKEEIYEEKNEKIAPVDVCGDLAINFHPEYHNEVAKVIIEDCADQFEGAKSLVEVAGVTGKIAKEIKKVFPNIKYTVLELPHVIDAIEKCDEIEYVVGDMFQSIPSADVLILKWVLMLWNDEECVKILTQCKKVVPSKENGGKIIIMEKVTDIHTPDVVHDGLEQTKLYWDLQMMVHVTGKQRTEKEWKSLFDAVGFKEYKIISALGMRCIKGD